MVYKKKHTSKKYKVKSNKSSNVTSRLKRKTKLKTKKCLKIILKGGDLGETTYQDLLTFNPNNKKCTGGLIKENCLTFDLNFNINGTEQYFTVSFHADQERFLCVLYFNTRNDNENKYFTEFLNKLNEKIEEINMGQYYVKEDIDDPNNKKIKVGIKLSQDNDSNKKQVQQLLSILADMINFSFEANIPVDSNGEEIDLEELLIDSNDRSNTLFNYIKQVLLQQNNNKDYRFERLNKLFGNISIGGKRRKTIRNKKMNYKKTKRYYNKRKYHKK